MENIEKETAETILEQPLTIKIGNDEYKVERPTIGTLLMLSTVTSELDGVDMPEDEKNPLYSTLQAAKAAPLVAKAAAIMILGAKRIREEESRSRTGIIGKKREKTELEALTEKLMYDYTPREIYTAMVTLLGGLQLQDFFALFASLRHQGLARPTREAKATAPGL